VDRLATSTIALDGSGRAVETPGGWQDFLHQNPGYFQPLAQPVATATPKAAAPKAPAARPTKLSYKDQRRLQELEGLVAELPERIRKLEADMADPDLYAKDRAKFDRLSATLDATRSQLEASEEEWMALEEQREALEAGKA